MHTYPCATHVRALSVNLRPSRQEGEAEDGALKLETGGRRESTLPHPPIPTDQVLSAKSIRESGHRIIVYFGSRSHGSQSHFPAGRSTFYG